MGKRLFSADLSNLGAVPQAGLGYVAANSLKTLWQGTTFEGGLLDGLWWEVERAGGWLGDLVGFGVPHHDAMARKAGQFGGARLQRAHRGAQDAAYELGERSARDLVAEHQRGFQEAAGQMTAQPATPDVEVHLTVEPLVTDETVTLIQRASNKLVRQGRANVNG